MADNLVPDSMRDLPVLRQFADAVSISMSAILGRQYLEAPIEGYGGFRALPATEKESRLPGKTCFLRIEQVGRPLSDGGTDALEAIRSVLSFCHGVKDFSLIFIVAHDGHQHRVYLGAKERHSSGQSANQFIDSLSRFIESNWTGTRAVRCGPYKYETPTNEMWRSWGEPLLNASQFVALTGVPSLRKGAGDGLSQSLDRFMHGMQGKPYNYIVIADPMGNPEVDDVILRCRDLIGQVHAFKEIGLSDTHNLTESLTRSLGHSQGKTIAETSGQSKSRGISGGIGLGLLTQAIGLAFPVTLPFAAFAAVIGPQIGLNRSTTTTQSTSNSTSHTDFQSEARSVSEGTAKAISRKILNAHAEGLEELLRRHIVRYQEARALGGWNVGIYLATPELEGAVHGAAQLRSLFSGAESATEPVRVHLIKNSGPEVQRSLLLLEQPRYRLLTDGEDALAEHPLGNSFGGLTTVLNTNELALPINLPRNDVPGIDTIPVATFSYRMSEFDLYMGHLANGVHLPYGLRTRQLASHTLVAGVNGSGKSNTIRQLLTGLHATKTPIPFMVIEPAKDEYVEWAIEYNRGLPADSERRIDVYMPGVTSWNGTPLADTLELNPFDVVWTDPDEEPQVLAHIDRLKAVLISAFPMQEVLPVLLDELIYYVYDQPPIRLSTDYHPHFDRHWPTITKMIESVDEVVKNKGYEPRIASNLSAALKTRLNSLRRGWKRDVFDSRRSTRWDKLFKHSAVVNLSAMGDDSDKCLAMSLLLQFLYEYRQACGRKATSPSLPLLHVTVIEEAHRVMSRQPVAFGSGAHPQAKAAEMFASMLSEIRAYGEGFVIADQVPGRLIPDAIKNTNLKIVHRLIATDDREAMAGCMNMTSEQTAMLSRLDKGYAIAFGERDNTPCWIKVQECPIRSDRPSQSPT
jgi:hypothetical protein